MLQEATLHCLHSPEKAVKIEADHASYSRSVLVHDLETGSYPNKLLSEEHTYIVPYNTFTSYSLRAQCRSRQPSLFLTASCNCSADLFEMERVTMYNSLRLILRRMNKRMDATLPKTCPYFLALGTTRRPPYLPR